MSEDLFKSPEKFDVVGQRLLTSHHLGPNTGTTSEGGVLEPPEVAVVDFAISSHLGQLPKPPQALRPTLFAPEAGLVRKQVIGTVLVHIGGTKVGHGGPQSLEPAHLKAPRAGLNVYSCSVSTTARTCKHKGTGQGTRRQDRAGRHCLYRAKPSYQNAHRAPVLRPGRLVGRGLPEGVSLVQVDSHPVHEVNRLEAPCHHRRHDSREAQSRKARKASQLFAVQMGKGGDVAHGPNWAAT